MKKSIVISLAAIVLLAGCAKEITAPEATVGTDNSTYVLRLGIPETKTVLGDLNGNKRKVYWSDGDQINVNGNVSNALSGIASNCTEAEFSFADPQTAPYNILYPASIWKDANTVTLPAEQQYQAGSFTDGTCPMAAYSADGLSATLKYLCAVVKVPVKKAADGDKIAAVYFASEGSENVSGDFAIDFQNATLTPASGSPEVRVNVGQDLSADQALDIYIVVPAATYASGFKVSVVDVNDHVMVKEKTGSVTLEAGHVYNLQEFEFVPDAAPAEVNISNANDLIQLATNYNNGMYTGQELTVNMTGDVTFNASTSAAYAATGGIGTADDGSGNSNYFHGTFNGNNKSIKSYTGNVPIFAYIGSSGSVKDLVIDSSCSYAFSQGNVADAYFAPVANYHKGVIDNVKVNATISLAEATDVEYLTAVGGIVGRSTTGTISNSTFAGAIDIADVFSTNKKLLVGGIAGYTSNAAGTIDHCTFDGTIGVAALVKSDDKTDAHLVVGGIVGYNRATVSNCESKDHPTVATLHSSSVGTIVVKTVNSYYTAVGGIAGENLGVITSCNNVAAVFNTIFKGGDATGRYLRSGGIVGKNDAEGVVEDCTNSGSVQHRSNPRLQSLGGIVGHNSGTVTGCYNSGVVNHMTTGISGATNKGGRIVNLGGIIGDNLDGAVVSDVHNEADIQISAMESNYDTTHDKPVCEVRMGGVIAYNLAAIDGGGSKNITNTGQVYFSPNFANQFIGYELGGIVGYSLASVQNAKNSGYVYFRWDSDTNVASKVYLGGIVGKMDADGTISGCVNEGGDNKAGEVNLYVKAGAAKHTDNYIGGILGYSESNVAISGCSNSGYVHGGNTTKQNGTSCYAGGIVAKLGGASSIANCTNSGTIKNDHSSNSGGNSNTAYNGGIAGWVSGTVESLVSITGCEHNTTELAPRRGYSGGIVGYANYASLQNNNVAGTNFSGSAYYIGGVAGWAVNTSISNCNVTGTSITSTQVQRAGGLVARLGDGSVLNGCSTKISSIVGPEAVGEGVVLIYGAVAGESTATSTIQNCHYPSSGTMTGVGESYPWQICGDSNFIDGGGNTANL